MRQRRIPCLLMRGGTSKAACFLADDLPPDPTLRDQVLLAVMGSPDIRQIDGLGGADPLTSKVAIVRASTRDDADVDYLFAQVNVERPLVDYGQNCGNVLAAVGPFAVERGLVTADSSRTRVRIFMQNTGQIAEAEFATPDHQVDYGGDLSIDGVPGTAGEIILTFKDIAGSSCGALLPSGRPRDRVQGVDITCIDNGMPVVLIRAEDVQRTGYESRESLDQDTELKQRLESIRLQAGFLMNLGDVSQRTVPKVSLLAKAREGGTLCSRTFIPHRCHASIGVLGAVSVASACLIPGSIVEEWLQLPAAPVQRISVEHPSGEFSVLLEKVAEDPLGKSALLRTARAIFDGEVLIPASCWPKS